MKTLAKVGVVVGVMAGLVAVGQVYTAVAVGLFLVVKALACRQDEAGE